MPQKVLPSAEELKIRRKHTFPRLNSADTSDEELIQIIREHARSFFLHEGGREEDWGENEEQSTREEMLRRFKDSEWGVALRRLRGQSHSHKNASGNNWIGGSFEIGNIAGINIMAESETLSKVSSRNSALPFIPLDSVIEPPTDQSESGTQIFFTHPSEPSGSNTQTQAAPNPSSPDPGLLIPEQESSPSSSTALLRTAVSHREIPGPSQTRSEPARRSIIKLPSLSRIGDSPNKNKKTVHYDLSPVGSASPSLTPASPEEVLERTGTDVSGTSAGAMSFSAMDDQQIAWGDIVMRGVSVYGYIDFSLMVIHRPNACQGLFYRIGGYVFSLR